jgi:hypothetical protein
LATRGRKPKDATTPELMAGSSSCALSGWGRVQLKDYASENVDNCEQPLTTLLELIIIIIIIFINPKYLGKLKIHYMVYIKHSV